MPSESLAGARPGPAPVEGETILAAIQALSRELGTVRAEGGPEFAARLAGAEDELAAIQDETRQQQQHIEGLLNGNGSNRAAMTRRFVSSLPLATVLTTSTGRILEANPAAHAMLRVPVGGLYGKPIFAYIAQDDRRQLRSALTRTAAADDDEPLQLPATVAPRHGPALPSRFALVPDPGMPTTPRPQDQQGQGAAPPEPADPDAGAAPSDAVTDAGSAAADPVAVNGENAGRQLSAVFWVIVPDFDAIEGPPSHQQLEALTRLCRLGADGSDLRTILGTVVRLCLQAMAEVSDVSLLVGNPLEPSLEITGSAVAQHLDGLQHLRAAGPAFDAFRSRRPVALDGTAVADHRGLSGDQQAALVRSLLAVPLLVDDVPAGVLTLYATGEHSTATLIALRQVMPFVEAAQSLIRDTTAYEELVRTQQQLQAALTSRAVIDQAKGMIMVTLKCDADEAFVQLVRMSSTRHEKVRDVAQSMVDDLVTERAGARLRPSE